MIEHLYEDLSVHLYEGEPITKKAPTPPPITYLTQWKIVGNSEVKTLPYPDGVVLPTGYKRCEYLTFDGSSYINTGVKTANDIGYNLRFKSTQNMLLIGGRLSIGNNGFVVGSFQNNSVYVSHGGKTASVPTTGNYNDNRVHRIILDSVKFQIDNEVVDISSLRGTADNFFDIYLGTWNNGGIPEDKRMWTSDIYDTIIYNTQGELWHGIPCLDANDVPCFYDIVSQTAFYNQGSGSFTYKLYPQPTEIWSCGEYSNVDSKYHIVVLPTGKQAVDIVLNEPLRKTDNTADTLEYPTETSGKALLTIRVEESGGELSPLDTPTTELVDAPQIEEAETYSMVISQGGKAVSWSSFIINND